MTDTYIKPLLNFLAMLAVFNLSSCGIENYIYLAPVTSISRTIDTISVTLPNGDQPDVFFSGYSIYYKIYKSSRNLTTVISTADFSSINKTMASDYAKIAPYLSTDALSAINMDAFFTSSSYGLTFFKLQTQTESENIDNLLNGSNSSFAIKTDDTSGLVIEISSTKYTLVRSVSNSQTPNKFIYSDNLSGDDVIVSEEGPPTTAYVLFFIVAYGVDEYGSPIFSRPAMLGVLQLPQNNYL